MNKNELKSGFSDATLNTLIQMAKVGMGTTLVPKMALEQIGDDVTTLPLNEAGPHRRLAFVTRLNYARVNDVKTLSEIFNEALSIHEQAMN